MAGVKRQGAGALRDASRGSGALVNAERPGVRQPSAAPLRDFQRLKIIKNNLFGFLHRRTFMFRGLVYGPKHRFWPLLSVNRSLPVGCRRNRDVGAGKNDRGKGFPHQGKAFPDAGEGFPDQGKGFPDEEFSFPDEGNGFPDEGKAFPREGSGFPDAGGSFPDEGNGFPDEEMSFPGQGKDFPGRENEIPGQENGADGNGGRSRSEH